MRNMSNMVGSFGEDYAAILFVLAYPPSLIPRPRPAICRLQYGKADDAIDKWQNFQNEDVQPLVNMTSPAS